MANKYMKKCTVLSQKGNASQNDPEMSSHSSQNGVIKKTNSNKC
jgi:hypothetical protein